MTSGVPDAPDALSFRCSGDAGGLEADGPVPSEGRVAALVASARAGSGALAGFGGFNALTGFGALDGFGGFDSLAGFCGLADFTALAGLGGRSASNDSNGNCGSSEPYRSGGVASVSGCGGAGSTAASVASTEELTDRATGVISARPVAAE
jgi:hypothetical protein